MNPASRDHLGQATKTHPRVVLLTALVPVALLVCLLAALGTAQGAPDTVNVTTTTDEVNGDTSSITNLISTPGGDGVSLREAVIAANNTAGLDEIILPSGIYTLTIEGWGEDEALTGDLDVTDDLTITGAGASITIIDAGGMTSPTDRVFHIGPGGSNNPNVGISDVTITNGDPGYYEGGGIWAESSDGTVALARCTITSNSAYYGGGGIAAYGPLDLADCTISGNNANFKGGGLRAWEPATIAGSAITGNSAGQYGGGIYADHNLTLNNTTVSGNSAEEEGGGVYCTAELQIADSTVNDNSAWRGSGIYQTGGKATLTYTLLAGNIAGVQGGGVFVTDGQLAMSHCDVNNNEAGTRGGGIAIMDGGSADITGSTISHNSSSSGGGLYVVAEVRDASLVLGSSVVSDNEALFGGGICVDSSKSTATATGSEISSNSGFMGGGLYNAGTATLTDCLVTDNSSYTDGGGIYNYRNLVDLSDTAVSGNSAASNGGGICNAEEGTLILGRSTISENSSDSGHGGGVFNDGSADLTNSTISGNSANTGEAVSSAGPATLTNVTVAWNSTTSAGALDATDGGEITIKNTIVANQPAGADCSGNVVTHGYNIDTDGTCNLTYFGDQPSTDPKIGPLQDNGGPTLTHALLETSPAIDAGDNSVGLTTDQRGFPRPVAGKSGCARITDIGAYEAPGFVDLFVTKSGSANPVMAGEELIYDLTAQNLGDQPATGVLLTDTLPVELEYLSDTDSCSVVGTSPGGGQILRCQIDYLPGCVSRAFQIKTRVKAGAVAWEPTGAIGIGNSAGVTGDQEDHNIINNLTLVATLVQDEADLRVLKTSTPDDAVGIGQVFTYTIYVDNLGPSYAREVRFNDEILAPGTLTILDWVGDPDRDDTCTVTGTTVDCQLNEPLEPQGYGGGDGRWTVLLRVQADERQAVDNVVTVFSGEGGTPDPDTSNNVAEDAIQVGPADLEIIKDVSPGPYHAGSHITYTLTITNHGPGTAVNVVLEDLLPEGLTVVEMIPSQGSCTSGIPGNPDAPLTCSLGELAPQASATVQIVALIDQGYDGYLENDALVYSEVYDGDNGNNRDTVIIQMDSYADLSISSTARGEVAMDSFAGIPGIYYLEHDGEVTAGRQIRYEITVENKGASDALDVIVEDYSYHYWFFEFQRADGASCQPMGGSGNLLCELGTIPAGTSKTFDIYMLVYSHAPDTAGYFHSSTVTSPTHDPFLDDNYLRESIIVHNQADLSIRKTSEPWIVYAGGEIRYDLTVTNHGPSYAPGVSVTDTLPLEVEYELSTKPPASCSQVPGGPMICGWEWEEPLLPGESRDFSVYARVLPDTLPGTISNQATVETDIENLLPYNDSDTAANSVKGTADLKIQKFGKPEGLVAAGEELTYTVIVDNLGTGYAHDVLLTDLLESSGTFELISVTSSRDADCSPPSGIFTKELQLTCGLTETLEVATTQPGSGRWMLTVVVRAAEAQDINNVAKVASSDYDPDLSNNEATAEHEITAVADLEITKTAWGEVPVGCVDALDLSENEVAAGGTLTYTLTVTNHGPSTAQNVVVRDQPLPSVLEIEEVTPGQGTCDKGYIGAPDYLLTCNLGTLLPDQSETVTIVARVPSWVPDATELVNVARVYSKLFDDNNGNDFFTNESVVTTWANLEVLKTQDPEIALPTQPATYTITVTNLGPSDAEGLIVSDTLPVQMKDVSWDCCATGDGECQAPLPPTCPEEPCPPLPDVGLYAQADIPAGEWAIYTVSGTLDFWPCGPFTNTVEVIPPQSMMRPEEDIDPCDDNNTDITVNDPLCNFDPLVLKSFPGPDSPL